MYRRKLIDVLWKLGASPKCSACLGNILIAVGPEDGERRRDSFLGPSAGFGDGTGDGGNDNAGGAGAGAGASIRREGVVGAAA